jgi:hypothetical protein
VYTGALEMRKTRLLVNGYFLSCGLIREQPLLLNSVKC